MFKRINIISLVIILTLVLAAPAYAQTDTITDYDEPYTTLDSDSSNEISIIFDPAFPDSLILEVPISSDASAEGIMIEDFIGARSQSSVWITVNRSGDTQRCLVILHWSGPNWFNSWRFTSLTVDNGRPLIFKRVFGTIPGATRGVDFADHSGTITLGTVNIPTNETHARVVISGLQGYRILPTIGWLSAQMNPHISPIR